MTIRPRRSVLYMPGSNARAIEAFEDPQQNSTRAALVLFPERRRMMSLFES